MVPYASTSSELENGTDYNVARRHFSRLDDSTRLTRFDSSIKQKPKPPKKVPVDLDLATGTRRLWICLEGEPICYFFKLELYCPRC